MSGITGLKQIFKGLPVVAKIGLVLLLGGGGLAVLAIIWLVIFGLTDGAAPIPTPPGASPTPALVMLGIAALAVVIGFVLAVIFARAVRTHPRSSADESNRHLPE